MGLTDILFQFTEWLRTTPVVELSLWISNTQLSMWIGTHFWAIPIIQTLHILAIAMAFGSVLLMNLRILGVAGTGRSVPQMVARYQPWVWWSLLVLVVTGLGMIIGEPVRELVNPVFWVKVVLILAMVAISLWFHAAVARNMARWEQVQSSLGAVRATSFVLILLWCAIMLAGRWIAYAPV